MKEKAISTVLIPSGAFIMGTDIEPFYGTALKQSKYAKVDEAPMHVRFLDSYRIDRYPITNAQYAAFIQDTDHPPPSYWKDGEIPDNAANLPVVQVSWFDCDDYTKWIEKRLPTEPEWEKAARGPDGRVYPWGDVFVPEEVDTNYAISGVTQYFSTDLTPVGFSSKNISPYEVCDIAGNVWEWTSDTYSPYSVTEDKQRVFCKQEHRVIRGGSWLEARDGTAERYYRCANRLHAPPDYKADNIGFRCVQDVQHNKSERIHVMTEHLEQYVKQKKLENIRVIQRLSRKNCITDTLIALSLVSLATWGIIRSLNGF